MSPDSGWGGVFFDLDGTLADTVELILLSYRHTMEVHLGEVLPDERWLATIGTPLPKQLEDFARSEGERLEMLNTYVTFQRSVHDDMVRPFPGAVRVLSALRRRGVRLAVVTSKGQSIARRTMEACGLWGGVDVVVCGDEVSRGKPHPEPVLRALDALSLGGAPERVLFVGDSPFDIQAGRGAGTCTAAVAWGPHARPILDAAKPDYFLEDLEDVLGVTP